MEQILNKLSEIELTAQRIMEDCDRQKQQLSEEAEQKCKNYDEQLESRTAEQIRRIRQQLEEEKDSRLHSYVQTQTLPFLHWMLITNSSTHNFQENCLRKYWLCKDLSQTLNDIRKGSEKQWEAYSPTADFPRKIRAMQSRLTTMDQFEEILQLSDVTQVAAYLKRMPEYSSRWDALDENTLHRGQIEKLLKKSIFQNFSRIYHFANPEQRKFLDLYSKRYEIRVLKEVMTNIFDHRDTDPVDVSPYREFFRLHSNIDVDRITTCSTMEELISCLKGNEFYIPLSKIQEHETALLFDYGMALDLYYFTQIWNIRKKLFKGKDLEEITRLTVRNLIC